MSQSSAGGSRGWLLPALLALAALVAAAALWIDGRASDDHGPADALHDPSATSSPPQPAPRKQTDPSERSGSGTPRRVVVESLGIDAPVVPVATQGTSLDPPADPQVLGWWSGGAPVGAARGTALVTGHTVNAGGGAMDDLEEVDRGADVVVTTSRGSVRYLVESVEVLDKVALAERSEQLFSQEVPGRLVLVTCEDWDGTGYRSNVVVTAVPA